MRLLRFGPSGSEKPGILDANGVMRDLSGHVPDWSAASLCPDRLRSLALLPLKDMPAVDGQVRLGAPFTGVGKFVAIGLNYSDHAAESGMPIPSEPIIFMKSTTCIQGPDDDVMLPKDSAKTDWEVELGVVIGRTARYVEEARALDHVAGYLVVNDVSERAYQLERGGTWDKGKGCDTFGPIGPWLVTTDEVSDPQDLDMWLELNGRRVQTGNTRTMIFGVATLVSYCSRFMTLRPGDIITTGTPPGVGMGMKPPTFLKAGDTMRLSIAGLGAQNQKVVPFRHIDD
jgi:2,4-diketo-3-deoxy-L-fuconate hydrolase